MSNLKHITIDCRMYGKNFGGIGRYVQEIVQYLIQNNLFFLTILANDLAYEELTVNRTQNLKIIKCSSKIFTLREQLELYNKIPKCDIFWSPYMNVPFLPIKARKRMVTLHDVFHIANPEYYSRLKRYFIKIYYYFSVTLSDKILTVSNFSKNEIIKYFGIEIGRKTEVIYNACEISDQDILPQNIDSPYILFVGSVKPHKNLKNALLAFKNLNIEHLRFVIVGKKEGFITGDKKVMEIVDRINEDNKQHRIFFTGNIEDSALYGFYKGARMLIMPSFYEGFGLPIIEAMHFNLPVACSDISVFHEIDQNNQLYYFNPNSVEDICHTIQKVLNSSDKIKYEEKFNSWDFVATNVQNAFHDILS